jgi:hypothetical protein
LFCSTTGIAPASVANTTGKELLAEAWPLPTGAVLPTDTILVDLFTDL